LIRPSAARPTQEPCRRETDSEVEQAAQRLLRHPRPGARAREAPGGRRPPIIKLNIGNLAPFGFDAPDEIIQDMIRNLPASSGYSDSKGVFSARKAVMHYTQQRAWSAWASTTSTSATARPS
jgi:aspartate/methionine/tyrosine aminotransferase